MLLKTLNHHQAKLTKLDIRDARKHFEKISRVHIKTRVHRITDKYIQADDRKTKIRIYWAGENNEKTIVYFHGGGWVVGSIESHDEVARLLCKNANANVISVDYRLAPEYPYPAAIEDGLQVVTQMIDDYLGLSMSKFYLAGDSAGAQIALEVAKRLSKPNLSQLKGLILIYPALDPALKTKSMELYATKHFVTKKNIQDFWKLYLGGYELKYPLSQNELKKLPPIFIQTAEYDVVRDDGHEFAEQLKKAGNEVVYRNYPGSVHGMMQIYSMLSGRKKALKDIASFVKST